MVACAETPVNPRGGTFSDPPCPLPPELRSDIAYRRAQGHPWDALGVSLHYHPDALRRATENDPAFAAVARRARKEAWHEGQAEGMRRLRAQADGCDEDRALRASKVLVEYAAEQQANETRLKVERIRARTRLAVEKLRAARRTSEEAEAEAVMPAPPHRETEPERVARVEREAAEGAVRQERAEVYAWGGKHPIGRSVKPDESDTRVRLVPDWSCGLGSRGIVYWVVPESAREYTPGTGIYFPPDEPGA